MTLHVFFQGKPTTESDGDEDDTEDEDEGANHFLLPGDEGFENDRPDDKCDSEDEHSEENSSRVADENQFLTSKQVDTICNDVAKGDESEEDETGASFGNKGMKRRIEIDSEEESSSEEESEEEAEFA